MQCAGSPIKKSLGFTHSISILMDCQSCNEELLGCVLHEPQTFNGNERSATAHQLFFSNEKSGKENWEGTEETGFKQVWPSLPAEGSTDNEFSCFKSHPPAGLGSCVRHCGDVIFLVAHQFLEEPLCVETQR